MALPETEIRNPERNDWLGIPANILKKVQEIARAAAPYTPSTALVDLLIGDAPKALDKLSYGERVTTGKGETLRPDPALLDLGGLLPQGKAVAAAKSIAAALGAKGAMALGALRAGGRPDLLATHGTTIDNLFAANDRAATHLYSPSLAVTPGSQLDNSFADGITLIPRTGAFDPATSNSSLFNRDVWTPRYYHYDGSARDDAAARLADKLTMPHDGGRLGGYDPADDTDLLEQIGRTAGIYESPRFPSFKAFEQSPYGARVLTNNFNAPENASTAFEQILNRHLKTSGHEGLVGEAWTDARQVLVKQAQEGDKEAQKILQLSRKLSSNYGELKVHGDVPLVSDYWAGALMWDRPKPEKITQESLREIKEVFRKGGIPVVEYKTHDPVQRYHEALWLQDTAGPIVGRQLTAYPKSLLEIDRTLPQWQDPRKVP